MIKPLTVFIVCSFFFSLAGAALSAEKIRVAFVSPSPTQSPPWIAKETGLFAKHGLDADIILITGSPRLVQSLIAGDVDYAVVGAVAAIRARMRGADAVILATATNYSNMKLLITRKSGIRRLEDLKGRVIGVSQYGSEADSFARVVVEKGGLRPDKDVAILQFGGHPQVAAALLAGKIEAGILGGFATLTAQKAGAVVFSSAVELKSLALSGTVATTGSRIQRNRDSVTRFMRAYVEGFRYFKTKPDGTIPILQKYMGGITGEQARFVYDEVAELFEDLPVPKEKAIQAVLDRETDPKAKISKPADFVDLSILNDIDRSGLVDKIYRK